MKPCEWNINNCWNENVEQKTLEKENRLLKQIKAKPIDFMISLLISNLEYNLLIVTNKIFI